MFKGSTFDGNYQTARMTVNFTGSLAPPSINLEENFEEVFKSHFKSLHAYACTLLRDSTAAEEIVQTIFVRLWEKKEALTIREKLSSYLYRAVHNESLNYLQHLKRKSAYQSHAMRQHTHDNKENASEKIGLRELESRLEKAMNELPEQCRTIFQLSRFEELKYKEIADRLDLSIKTVENQMGKALRLMRLKLLDYLAVFLVILFHLIKQIH
jgi:RNA polymerase sigma-70 factor (ECF subfamily)